MSGSLGCSVGSDAGPGPWSPDGTREPGLLRLLVVGFPLLCRADILVAAMGRPRLITGTMLKPGALVVFSGDLDRVLAAFLIVIGASTMGQQVSMFFTFWGLSVLKKGSQLSGKTLFQKMMALRSPGSSKSLPVSTMN